MEITFTLTKKDYWEYNKYTIFHVWAITRIFILTPAIVIAISLAAGLIFKLNMWVCLALAIFLPLFYVASIFVPMYRGIMKIPQDQLKPQTLRIDLDKGQLVRKTEKKIDKYNKDNVYKCRRKKDYIFITMTTYASVIIPDSSEYNLDEVLKELEKVLG